MPGQAAALHAAITKDSIETAYCFLHQKRNVYIHSSLDWQKDDIEYAIASYAESMNQQCPVWRQARLPQRTPPLHGRHYQSRGTAGEYGVSL